MSINKRIIEALNLGIPCSPDVYTGNAEEYTTFNYNTLASDFGDDEPAHERFFIQVHYICPLLKNSISSRKSIRNNLIASGFVYSGMIDATDGNGQHWIFEAEWAEGLE